jgi:hypothetical protein
MTDITDIKKLTDIINKSLVGKSITFVKHRSEPQRMYTLQSWDKPTIGFETKPCDLPEYLPGPQFLSVTVDGKKATLRLPQAAYARLVKAMKLAEVERDSDKPIHVWMCRDGEGYRTDFRALVSKLDTEYSPGPLVDAFKTAIKADAVLSLNATAPVAKKGICQCSMQDLMSGVPHRSDCPEKP